MQDGFMTPLSRCDRLNAEVSDMSFNGILLAIYARVHMKHEDTAKSRLQFLRYYAKYKKQDEKLNKKETLPLI